jgi:hypothetical protein
MLAKSVMPSRVQIVSATILCRLVDNSAIDETTGNEKDGPHGLWKGLATVQQRLERLDHGLDIGGGDFGVQRQADASRAGAGRKSAGAQPKVSRYQVRSWTGR